MAKLLLHRTRAESMAVAMPSGIRVFVAIDAPVNGALAHREVATAFVKGKNLTGPLPCSDRGSLYT